MLQSSSLWDLILFKTMIDLKEKQGLINQLLSAIDIIHISLGSLLHDCLTPLEKNDGEGEMNHELEGFRKLKKMKLRQEIPFKYSNFFKTMQLLEKVSLNNYAFDEESDIFNQADDDLSSTIKVELEEYKNERLNIDFDDFDYPDEEDEEEFHEENKILIEKTSPELSLECSKCHKLYSSKNNVRRHMKKCLSNKEEKVKVKFRDFVCVFCETSYSTFLGYKNHVNVTCSKKPEVPLGFLCDKCKIYVFKPPGSEHSCEPYFNCDKCNFKCYNENHFRQHYRLVHLNVGTIYCCEVCGKTFDSKTRLGNHLVVHTKERSFLCTECGKGFGRKSVWMFICRFTLVKMCPAIFVDGILTREACPHCSSSFRTMAHLQYFKTLLSYLIFIMVFGWSYRRPGVMDVIEENDVVIIYIGFNNVVGVNVTPMKVNRKGNLEEHVLQTPFGAIKVQELIGVKYGTRIIVSKSNSYVYALRPTPELWTKCLPHRTQILYTMDASMIVAGLELKTGSTVIESGTGSGSLSHALARVTGSDGKLFTFDFHEERAKIAQKEFKSHGLDSVIVEHRDVCSKGFGLDVLADGPLGRICSFSPCIEQVQKAALSMKEQGFKDIRTIEVLLREFQVRKIIQQTYAHDMDFDLEEDVSSSNGECAGEENGEPPSKRFKKVPKEIPSKSFITGLPLTTMPGHTGYLTFATNPLV
ncbi:TRM61 [Lepeophtheirus salmonis]|uniref:tRNA (adenine(58)-N(1))-methyltransferase n=1 Tax=Lepeophtheirus salmonis TaxID=72036 RepID=A0A7R8CPP4_LEPSM|nr:TRM61 [Lepeophtheirus salmonis]CAF2841374.1 TRM61 [Lepeophtheirus salmonis]